MALTLTSPAFVHGAAIPTMYTCDGADRSPPLAWDSAPDLGEPDNPGLHRVMEGDVLATAELMGVYERSR